MIPVALPNTPVNFEARVRQPGLAFLTTTLHPTHAEWNAHNYWSRVHGELYAGHAGICVYCASWTPRRHGTGGIDHTSIDHFVPKSRLPREAYNWTNFRLSRSKLNQRKDRFEDVIDPCALQPGLFRLDFTTFLIQPAPGIPAASRDRVRDTVDRLGLNSDNQYVIERARAIYRYVAGRATFAEITRRYPFIAAEMLAQQFDAVLRPAFQAALDKRPSLAN